MISYYESVSAQEISPKLEDPVSAKASVIGADPCVVHTTHFPQPSAPPFSSMETQAERWAFRMRALRIRRHSPRTHCSMYSTFCRMERIERAERAERCVVRKLHPLTNTHVLQLLSGVALSGPSGPTS